MRQSHDSKSNRGFSIHFRNGLRNAPQRRLPKRWQNSRLIQKREAAYKQLERAQSQLESASNQLVKINSQDNATLPKSELKKTIATLKLAKLDHKTFDAYYKELTDAEQDFFDTVAADPSDKAGIEDALGQLNQYDSSLGQQADIVEANLQSVTADAQSLHAAALKMK